MKKYIYNFLLLIAIVLFACSKDDIQPQKDLSIAQEIKDLIYFNGDERATTVLVNTQGGPSTELFTKEFIDVLKNIDTAKLLKVNVHQKQTLNPELFNKKEITFEQAISFDSTSIEMLYKVIKYFKNQDRTVYVLGISFGAFITQELIAKKGIDTADKYLIMVGRLEMEDIFWKGFSEGKNGRYENGTTPILMEQTDVTHRNMSKMAAGLGKNRYTETLRGDLSKVTYVYGKTDDAVGRLTEKETKFLKSKKALVIASEYDHTQTINKYIATGFEKAFGIK